MSARRRWATLVAASCAAAAVVLLACGPPPDGWTGAGRTFTLPTAAMGADAGADDTGSVVDTTPAPVPVTDGGKD